VQCNNDQRNALRTNVIPLTQETISNTYSKLIDTFHDTNTNVHRANSANCQTKIVCLTNHRYTIKAKEEIAR